MNVSRQTLLGLAMMVGGSVVLFAMVQQIGDPDQSAKTEPTALQQPADDRANKPSSSIDPMTTDVETEQRILAQKQKQREARVAQQEKRAKEFLAEQERAEAEALAKARAENQQYMNNAIEPVSAEGSPEVAAQSVITKPKVQARTEAQSATTPSATPASTAKPTTSSSSKSDAAKQAELKAKKQAAERQEKQAAARKAEAEKKAREAEQASAKKAAAEKAKKAAAEKAKAQQAKAKSSAPTSSKGYVVQRGDGLIKLSRQYNVPVEALAQANNMKASDNLRVGQEITIPSQRQISRLEREAAEAKRRAEAAKTAQQRLAEGRRLAAKGEAKGSFGVQVALADNQAKADEVAKKLRSAGYRVTTSQTSRGVRVIVGPETGKPAALALKDKINADPRTGVNNAWVLYWR